MPGFTYSAITATASRYLQPASLQLLAPLCLSYDLTAFLAVWSVEPRISNRELTNMSSKRNATGNAETMGIENIDGLYSYALVLTRNHAEAEDLVQEAYVRAIQAMRRLRADSNIKGWLFTILRNIWLNQLRKRRTGPQMVEMEVEDSVANSIAEPSKNSHDLYVAKMEIEEVRAAIQKLPIDFCEIILLREYEDLSYQEIADILDCPVGTVMSRLARARARLRALLAANGFQWAPARAKER
jgi:RNA polymerase sigma-70 factor, ECF subfamily